MDKRKEDLETKYLRVIAKGSLRFTYVHTELEEDDSEYLSEITCLATDVHAAVKLNIWKNLSETEISDINFIFKYVFDILKKGTIDLTSTKGIQIAYNGKKLLRVTFPSTYAFGYAVTELSYLYKYLDDIENNNYELPHPSVRVFNNENGKWWIPENELSINQDQN